MPAEPKSNPIDVLRQWPAGSIVYHIYPRSFQDSNGDGIGDLAGISSRLEYIQSLGVTTIWISPFYPSPMADFGYDVADYCAVDPVFGTMADFSELLRKAHNLHIRVMVDLVPNHTSDQHAWFLDSRQSRHGEYADWYIWRDGPAPDQLPNNWRDALTGGPAWQWCEQRQQYYLHSFAVHQPDLNWSNPALRAAIKEVMRFWLRHGIDGFRVDAVYWLAKDPFYRDDSPNPLYNFNQDPAYEALLHDNSHGWPQLYAYVSELADTLKEVEFAERPRFMVTEAYPARRDPVAGYMAFYDGVDPHVAAPFNFEGISLPWQASTWRQFLADFHQALDQPTRHGLACYAFGNHDQPRLLNRLGGAAAARSAAVLLLTLPGLACIYYGEEIGMHNVIVATGRAQDPATNGNPKHSNGRDPERTPMQWDGSPNAGFSTAAVTWLPVADDYETHNVATEEHSPNSFLHLYRALGKLRTEQAALQYGTIQIIKETPVDVLAYIRADADSSYGVVINFSNQTVSLGTLFARATRLISSLTVTTPTEQTSEQLLRPHEAVVFDMQPLSLSKFTA